MKLMIMIFWMIMDRQILRLICLQRLKKHIMVKNLYLTT